MLKRVSILLCLLAVLVQSFRRTPRTYLSIDPYPFCGHRFISGDPYEDHIWKLFWEKDLPSKRIVGGQESIPGSWPWQVALLINGTQFCAGSLINEQWVVTATHCFHDNYSSTNPKFWTATLGEHRLKEKDVFEQVRQVERIILHPKYKSMFLEGIFDTPPDYDVALVKLEKPTIIDEFVYPICLLHPDEISFHPGKECYITGWGHTKFNGTQPPALNEAKTRIVSTEECNKKESYNGTVHGRSLCAGFQEGGVDTCQYDSGGPLSCEKDGQYYLTGVVSWGHGCASPHKYGVYSNMAVLTSWVVKSIKEIEAAQSYHYRGSYFYRYVEKVLKISFH